ncbi:MAG: MASE3 domain-containing protein [Thermodesulfobacteriota bacterium]
MRDWEPYHLHLKLFLAAFVVVGLYLTSLKSYLLFHALIEIFSIVVGCGIFVFAWNSRSFLKNNYLLFLGVAYFSVAWIDLLHTLSYKGMGALGGSDANLPTQLWVAGRYVQSSALVIAPLVLDRRLNVEAVTLAYSVLTAALLFLIFPAGLFPDCFIEGFGLTRFKIVSEYVICMLLLGALTLLNRERDRFDADVFRLLAAALLLAVASELMFTFYADVYDVFNMMGHYFRLSSYYCTYLAIIETGLRKPYALLVHELTEERKALAETETRFRNTFEQAAVGICHLEVSGRLLRVNRKLCDIVGFSPQEMVDSSIESITHPDDLESDLALRERLLEGALRTYSVEKRFVRRDASIIRVNLTVSLVRDSQDQPDYLIGVIEDITDRKLAEEALKESEERFRELAENMEDAFWLTHPYKPKKVAYRSPGYYRIWERTEEEFQAQRGLWQNTVHKDDIVGVLAAYQDFTERDRDFSAEYRIIRPDGAIRWIWDKAFPIRDESGRLRRVAGLAQDVTQRKIDQQKQEELNEEIRRFSHIISHDLRSPVANLRGFALELEASLDTVRPVIDEIRPSLTREQRLMLDQAVQQDMPESLEFIGASLARIDGLVNAVLNLARLGYRKLYPERLDMNDLVWEVLYSFAHQIESSKVAVGVGDLPWVVADRVGMEQIMGNLLGNALKYLDPARTGQVSITGERLSEETVFHLSDNGIGIAREDQTRVFEIFQRAEGTDVPGDGMGLAYVRALVRRHGGRIWCESELGSGSAFSFSVSNSFGQS